MEEIEIWKQITEYPLYWVSSLGKIKRSAHTKEIYRPDINSSYLARRKERLLAPSENSDGYVSVKLYGDSPEEFKNLLVHRLVASAFIDNTENKPTVNHISGVKNDNRLCNLEWSTDKEQSEHANLYSLVPEHLRMKKVLAYDINGHFVEEFPSMKDAERALDILQVRISEMCRGLRKSAYRGYFFEYSVS